MWPIAAIIFIYNFKIRTSICWLCALISLHWSLLLLWFIFVNFFNHKLDYIQSWWSNSHLFILIVYFVSFNRWQEGVFNLLELLQILLKKLNLFYLCQVFLVYNIFWYCCCLSRIIAFADDNLINLWLGNIESFWFFDNEIIATYWILIILDLFDTV